MSDRPTLERRSLGAPVTVTEGPGRLPVLRGTAVVFNVLSEVLTGSRGEAFRERVHPAALQRLRERRDLRLVYAHDQHALLGTVRGGTLRVATDARGVHFECDPPDTTVGRDVLALVRRGDIAGCSFGFRTLQDAWHRDQRPPVRELLDVDAFELTLTSLPAYGSTSVQVEQRALDTAYAISLADRQTDRRQALDGIAARLEALRR